MAPLLCIIAGLLFVVSAGGHFYVKLRLRPRDDSDLDDYHWEFEEQHPEYARYLKWSKITLAAVIVSMLLMFITLAI